MDNISDISNFTSRQFSNDEIGEHFNSMASPTQNSPMSTNLTSSGSNTSVSTLSSHNGTVAVSKFPPGPENQPIFTKPRLSELVREVDGSVQLDEDVEELLLQIADDFVDDAINSSCLFAKHRKSNKIEVRDVQLHLERKWNMWIPGFGTDELRPYKRSVITEAHKQRLALIRKTIKKY